MAFSEGFIKLQIKGKGEGTFGFFLYRSDTDEAEGQWITLDGSMHELWLEVPEKGDYYIYVHRDYQGIDDENDSFTYKVIYTCYTSEGRRVFRLNRSRFCDGYMERGYIYTS